MNAVCDETFAQRLDDRNAASSRRLEPQRDIVLLGQRRQFRTMIGEQRLVRGDKMLAVAECRLGERIGRAFLAADQLDNHIAIAVRERRRIVRPRNVFQIAAALLGFVARRNANDFELAACAFANFGAALGKRMHHACAHRTKPGDGKFQRFHFALSRAGVLVRIERNFFTLRAA